MLPCGRHLGDGYSAWQSTLERYSERHSLFASFDLEILLLEKEEVELTSLSRGNC